MAADPMAGTRLARVELPENVYSFGWAELRYLLRVNDTPGARTSTSVLGFDEAPLDDVTTSAALSSLLARGLMSTDGDRVLARGEAAAFQAVAGRAVRWSAVSLRSHDVGDLLVLVEDGYGLALMQPRSLGTWFMGLSDHVEDPAGLLAEAVTRALDAMPQARFALESRTQQGVVGRRFFQPDGADWLVSESMEGPTRSVPRSGLLEQFRAVLPHGPR